MLAGPPCPGSRLAAHERALQGIVEIIITVITLVNTSEMIMQDCSVSQSLFLEGNPFPDALPLCFTLTGILSFIWNFMPFSTAQPAHHQQRLHYTDKDINAAVTGANTGGSAVTNRKTRRAKALINPIKKKKALHTPTFQPPLISSLLSA